MSSPYPKDFKQEWCPLRNVIEKKERDIVKEDYNPEVEEALLSKLGEVTNDNLLVLVTVSVPSDLTKMSVNLQGPFIINVDERKACQVIVDTDKFPVRYPIYDILQARKAGE